MATISFAITACNEHVELDKLLTTLYLNIKEGDEIVVQLDTTATPEVRNIVSKPDPNVVPFKLIEFALNNDFATFKNNLKSICTNEWIFFIDADEYLSDDLLFNIHEILDANEGIVDVISVPRINTVDGLTREHIDKWRWFVDENGYVNYPDYQTRICSNKSSIIWVNKVHERLTGWKTTANLPYGYDLIHPKTIERQERQNNYYNTI
jgi:glycosyltransferase involved in cell wall biosynthesis